MFNLLSVVEDDGHSDRLTAVQTNFAKHRSLGYRHQLIKISVTSNSDLILSSHIDGCAVHEIEFLGIDVDSLIDYLQDVKVFLAEEKMIKKLKAGK
jgi:hypothetical protein